MNPCITADEGYCEISFAEKVRLFSFDYLSAASTWRADRCRRRVHQEALFGAGRHLPGARRFSRFHGAKNNEQWYLYRELAAAVRHLSLGGYSQKHIANRLIFYDLPQAEEFREAGRKAAGFLNASLMKLAPAIIEEARRLNVPYPKTAFGPEDFPGTTTGEMLPYDIDDESKDLQKKNIVKIASEFLSISSRFDLLRFYEPYSLAEIRQLVPNKVNEVAIRRYEMVVHNLQSSFDTYVIQGGLRFGR
jgi:hypothetical protein